MLTDGQIFRSALHAARVYRKAAAEQQHAAGRIFWLRSAIGAYQTARRARDRMRFV
jgi:hypothetical protein